MTAPQSSLGHFEAMAWLLKELAPARIELQEHQYSPRVFGSFALVLGRGHKEVRCTWDGRDSLLSIEFRENRSESWTHDANISVPNGEGLYAEIASQASEMFSV